MHRLQKWRLAGIVFFILVMILAILSIIPIFYPVVTESSASNISGNGFYNHQNEPELVTIIEWLSILLN